MLDGSYDIETKTPIGMKRGTAKLATDGDSVTAEVEIRGMGTDQMRGSCSGPTFALRGERRQFPLGKVAYSIEGEVVDGVLSARLTSKAGELEITGRRRP